MLGSKVIVSNSEVCCCEISEWGRSLGGDARFLKITVGIPDARSAESAVEKGNHWGRRRNQFAGYSNGNGGPIGPAVDALGAVELSSVVVVAVGGERVESEIEILVVPPPVLAWVWNIHLQITSPIITQIRIGMITLIAAVVHGSWDR